MARARSTCFRSNNSLAHEYSSDGKMRADFFRQGHFHQPTGLASLKAGKVDMRPMTNVAK
jgi:hypothetical protein